MTPRTGNLEDRTGHADFRLGGDSAYFISTILWLALNPLTFRL